MPGHTRTRLLSELAEGAAELFIQRRGAPDTVIEGLAYDSRDVGPGDLFFAVPGTVSDGHDFVRDAVQAGAAALCVERPTGLEVPELVVTDARRAMGRVAAEFYGRPADGLLLVGVTGTNGKTTTVFLLESIFRAAGLTAGLIGTIETRVAGQSRPGVRTTPESVDLQRLLFEMRGAGVEAVAMEVTSHALALHRVEGLRFASATFTNLSQDHLDFHRTMEEYFEAKRRMFAPERAAKAAINLDDPWGRKLAERLQIPCLSYGTHAQGEVTAQDPRFGPWGSEFTIAVKDVGEIKVMTPLVGSFNVSNCLSACTAALQAGINLGAIERGIKDVQAVPGRFESIDSGQPFSVIVDYAHSPDSLDTVLRGARNLADDRVLCVFGCGGDRDRGKRPLMGAVAGRLADVVVVTSDNPRSEDPHSIIDAILEGVIAEKADGPDAVLPDRREAIAHTLAMGRAGDVIVIAGKGHETGQQVGDLTIPFDDRVVARAALAELGWAG